ncbi:NAD(P)-binding protein [Paenibacillus piri]|uniref:Amine oxidoreductase n=1 Tax=Paenibacillus piri TaxID=2547395 RepID=A0A4R5KKX4_9BACL|nr:NAD(P)-binding protein [Paenibacillus piri]TDF96213.1 amine oxidoreductase [Paenibacillus piri]
MYKEFKYVILGAGPSGLSFAHRLLENGETSFLIVEKENIGGGLCRSKDIDGSPLDIGGGHFLDVRKKNVLDFLFKFLPEDEWNKFERISKIIIRENEIDYPFESNIWQLPADEQIEYLISISQAGCNNNKPMPDKFKDWIYWKLGNKIAEEYMIPYNNKIQSIDLDRLGTYWLYKLPDVSFRDTLESCLKKQQSGTIPAHAHFLYPKNFGYGEVWNRMATAIKDNIEFNTSVESVDFNTLVINNKYKAQIIINTIPWIELVGSIGIPDQIINEINTLEYNSIDVTYYDESVDTSAHWTYIPDESISHHRILYRKNFCANSIGYWTETNSKRSISGSNWKHTNKYAYPLNTIEKPKSINAIREWSESKFVYGLGRWGEWEHMNSDVAVEKGLNLADFLIGKL